MRNGHDDGERDSALIPAWCDHTPEGQTREHMRRETLAPVTSASESVGHCGGVPPMPASLATEMRFIYNVAAGDLGGILSAA